MEDTIRLPNTNNLVILFDYVPTEDYSFRIDFIRNNETFDEKTGKFSGSLIPDPERYEWTKINDEEYLHDKFDNILISKEEYGKMLSKMNGVSHPLYFSRPKISNIDEYAKSRIQKIKEFLSKGEKYVGVDKSEEFLNSLKKDQLKFVILTIDIKESTKLSQKLTVRDNAKAVSLFAKEMSALVYNYNGYVLKYTGDGLIAYFPEPNFIGQNDLAFDCAYTMKKFTENYLNKILSEQGLPKLKFRIGIDSGESMVITIGDPSTKQHKDLISETANLSSKIQGVAPKNGIVLGDSTARNLHITRRKFCVKYSPSNWKYKQKDGKIYPLHQVVIK